MKGFFSPDTLKSKTRSDGRATYSCVSCGLYKDVCTPKMEPYGNFKKGILNIGGFPDKLEDKNGKPFYNKKSLKQLYRRLGIDLFEDCLNINSVNCRTPDDRPPSDYEIGCCRKKVLDVIEKYKPIVIVLFGNIAVRSLIGYRWKKGLGGIHTWRGWTIPDRDLNAWICPVFSTNYLELMNESAVETIWKQDLQSAILRTHEPLPKFYDDRANIEYITKEHTFEMLMEDLSGSSNFTDLAFFDFETTGLKPHKKEQQVVCASIATQPDKAYAFMLTDPKWQELFCKFLRSDIKKGAANMKFEDTWSTIKLGHVPRNWVWDTMQAGHVLDNRPGITSLKFQAYVQLGVADYDSHINPYLKGIGDDGGNSLNRIFEFIERFGERDLLTYCGLDSLFEYQLGLIQMEQLGFDPRGGIPDDPFRADSNSRVRIKKQNLQTN